MKRKSYHTSHTLTYISNEMITQFKRKGTLDGFFFNVNSPWDYCLCEKYKTQEKIRKLEQMASKLQNEIRIA